MTEACERDGALVRARHHKSYGRIYTPVFEVIEWVGMDGASTEPEAAEAASDDAPAESRRRRRSA